MTASPGRKAAVSRPADTSAVALPTPRAGPRAGAAPLTSREASEHVRLQHGHGSAVHRYPPTALKPAHGGIDALPRTCGLVRELRLRQGRADDPVGVAGLTEQHLR